MESFIGRDIGKYHIIEQLGEGGMAVVYKAFDTSLERFVAIKFIRKETIGEQYYSQLIKRFEREAKVLASLNHPNIVTIFDYGEYQGSPYLVEMFIPGGTLHPGRQALPYTQAANLLAPVARALEYAHHRGVIHRDIKPSNILISETGAPLLTDFGIAKILDLDNANKGEEKSLTSTGMQIGTPEYMAPEQWQGKPGEQSDIYALGVVLYELVTGRVPYTADTPAAVMIKQVTEPLPRPRQFMPSLPEELENVIFKALAVKIEHRYAVMGDFAAALERMSSEETPQVSAEQVAERSRRVADIKSQREAAEQAALKKKQQQEAERAQHEAEAQARREAAEQAALKKKQQQEAERAQREREKKRIRTIVAAPAEPAAVQPAPTQEQITKEPAAARPSRAFRIHLTWPAWLAAAVVLLGLILMVIWLAFPGSGMVTWARSNLTPVFAFFSGKSAPSATPEPSSTMGAQVLATQPPVVKLPSSTPTLNLPPLVGPDPSYQVAALYYPWYGNPSVDNTWIHWNMNDHPGANDIASSYFPALGTYSSNDPDVVAQHMTWLRQAGVGVIIVSWWGKDSIENKPVPLILEMAERYGIKVTFEIGAYSGRSSDSLISDFLYLCNTYGSSRAFFRVTASSRYSPNDKLKPIIFVRDIGIQDGSGKQVSAEYWQDPVNAIHELPQGGLIIANTMQPDWIPGGHFDGLYNFVMPNLDPNMFAWANSLPSDSLFFPRVAPGFQGERSGYPPETYLPREDGATYAAQWTAVLDSVVKPALVLISSFNEWHEGSMIEPIAPGNPYIGDIAYGNFGSVGPEGYLELTRQWVDRFQEASWPETYRVRIQITTTSDWTSFNILEGATWLRPDLLSRSPTATMALMDYQNYLALNQPLSDAEKGAEVEMTWDLSLTRLNPDGNIIFNVNRGGIGETFVNIFKFQGDQPILAKTIHWAGYSNDFNSLQVTVPCALLINLAP